jgi:hypothetical protein
MSSLCLAAILAPPVAGGPSSEKEEQMPLTDRPEFRAWLARHDAQTLEMRANSKTFPLREAPSDACDCCGGPVGETPSQVGEYCMICLAERFGGDQVEDHLAKVLIGGMVKAALTSDWLRQDLLRDVVLDAIENQASEDGFASGRAMERDRARRGVA